RPRDCSAMRCRLVAVLVVCSFAPLARAEGPTPKEARQRWLKGNYEEARALYEALANDPKQKALAAIGLSRVHQSLGEYDKALAVVDAAIQDHPKAAELH